MIYRGAGVTSETETDVGHVPISIGHMPVPVPISRICLGFCSGAKYNRLLLTIFHK